MGVIRTGLETVTKGLTSTSDVEDHRGPQWEYRVRDQATYSLLNQLLEGIEDDLAEYTLEISWRMHEI